MTPPAVATLPPVAPPAVAPGEVTRLLLAWYDGAARVLPWRVGPAERRAGARPDPYHVWLSEVMLQQTTVAAVIPRFRRFVERWPDVGALGRAGEAEVMAEWAGLGYYARARNLLRCAREVAQAGIFPRTVEGLSRLPGIGTYTAGAIAAIAFDVPTAAVDGNVERVMARLFRVEAPLPGARAGLAALARNLVPAERPGDFAQALMDLGATVCRPRAPDCPRCPLHALCIARAAGVESRLPRRLARAPKPVREGVVWALRTPAGWVVERRSERGLLGGMLGFPGDGWDGAGGGPPAALDWRDAGEVRHVFTHFHLRLRVLAARADVPAGRGRPVADLDAGNLPTLMRKALARAEAALAGG